MSLLGVQGVFDCYLPQKGLARRWCLGGIYITGYFCIGAKVTRVHEYNDLMP